ncbi:MULTISPECIES: methyl-accepting chemotaxis protein [Acetobacter]|uniref:methyl-accepting chemotaxis protein n=1 Tax=Acetobacter TaxID=434 RepID=UPI00376F5499
MNEIAVKLIDEIDTIIEREWPKALFSGKNRVNLQRAKETISEVIRNEIEKVISHSRQSNREIEVKVEQHVDPGVPKYIDEGLIALSAADLTYRIPTPVPAEFQDLCDDFNVMMETLQGTLRVINNNSQHLYVSGHEISKSTMDLAKRTESQASNLEETASALSEITDAVKSTAKDAETVRDIVKNAENILSESGRFMEETVSVMCGIKDSSSKIENIIGTINDIASQTNILAVNASIEAARAGVVGTGFAVVASEVRALAARTAVASKEIRRLIGDAGHEIEHGVQSVGNSQEALKNVVGNINQINTLTQRLAVAAQQQATGLQQINTAVSTLDQITQENAAMVEQSASTISKMAEETDTLQCFINQFEGIDGQPAVLHGQIDLSSALIAHAEWKAKLRTAIMRRQKLDAQTIAKDNCCMLGKWLYGPARQDYKNMPEFEFCRQKHAEFHRAAGEVAEVINDGYYDEATAMLKAHTPYAEASRSTGAAIMKLKEMLT